MNAKSVVFLGMRFNEQTLAAITEGMPVAAWKQWARERPTWLQGDVALVEKFIDHKRKDSLNIAADKRAGSVVASTAQDVKKPVT
jgi:hypothetical protein